MLVFMAFFIAASCGTAPVNVTPKDTSAPILTLLSPTNGQLVGGVYSLFGTVNDPQSAVTGVYVKVGDGVFNSVTIDNVVWSTNITLPVYGPVTNFVYTKNKDGATSLTQTVWVERVSIPGITIDSPENYINTKDPNLTVSGTAAVDAPYTITAVQVKLNSGSWVDAAGTTSWSKGLVLQEGLNLISARVIASSGKTNTVDNWQVTLDSTLPDIFIEAPADGIYTNSPSVTLSGIASNQAPFTISKVQVKLNIGVWEDAAGTASWSKVLALLEGTNSVSVRAISTADKTNSVSDWKIYLDTTKPVLTVVTPAANTAIVSNHYQIYGTAADMTSIEGIYVSVNAGAFKKLAGTTVWFTNLVSFAWETTYTVKIYAKDHWGYCSLTNTKIIYTKNKLIQTGYYSSSSYAGCDVALSDSGNTTVVGAYYFYSGYQCGAVFVNKLGATSWGITREWLNTEIDRYGWAVAMTPDGNTFVSGAYGGDYHADDDGSAYIYKWNGSSWVRTQIGASDGLNSDRFGFSVDISSNGNTVVAGSIFDDISAKAEQGSLYVYKWTTSWVETHLIAADGVAGDILGQSAAISGDGNTVVGGAMGDDIGANTYQGSINIFRWNGSGWDETKKWASDGATDDAFGYSVDISYNGNTIIVGSRGDGNLTGSAYIFKWNGVTWDQTKIAASDGSTGDEFGVTVGLSGDGTVAIVGAHLDDVGANANQGSVYVFKWSGSWVETKYVAPDGAASDEFGYSVSVNQKGTIAIVGAMKDDQPSYADMGSAWIFGID
jgi:hypothetical protein